MGNQESILYNTDAGLLAFLLLLGMVILLQLGNFIGVKLRKESNEENSSISTTIVAAVLGLFAFLLGFTFSMSGNRFENRRVNTINEANAIGTAILRADLYPRPERDAFRKDFKEYTQARIDYFMAGSDMAAMHKADQHAQAIAYRLWNRGSVNAVNATMLFPANLMLPALNDMFDSGNFNNYGEKFRVPDLIVILLFSLSLVCAFFLGYYSKRKGLFDSTITIGFCLLSALVIYTTLDLDRSRTGLITHHTSQQSLVDLLQQFDQPRY